MEIDAVQKEQTSCINKKAVDEGRAYVFIKMQQWFYDNYQTFLLFCIVEILRIEPIQMYM